MSSPSNNSEETGNFRPFTKAERIQQLNDIDKSIAKLLQTSVLALHTLSASRSDTAHTLDERKAAFEQASNDYLKTAHAVDVGLRRQIYGLEEANIIPSEKFKKTSEPVDVNGKSMPKGAALMGTSRATGLGKLDIGWLNSRSGRVGRDMEEELWSKARTFVENEEKVKGSMGGNGNEDVDMT